jgi:uncharacterized protein (DUF885 family)
MIRSLAAMTLSLLPILLLLPRLVVAQSGAADQTEAAQRFRAFLAEDWKRWMQDYPEMATAVGFPGQNRRWTDESPAGFDARVNHLRESVATLQQFHREWLPSSEQLNFDLYHELLETAVQGLPFGDDPMPFRGVTPANRWMPMNQMGGIQQGAAETLATMPHEKLSDYEDIIARLEALPAVVDQTSGNLQEGLKRGYTPPKITMRDVPKQITDLIPPDPLKSALLEPFTEFPPNFTAAERNRLTVYSCLPREHFSECSAGWSGGLRLSCSLANYYAPDTRTNTQNWASRDKTNPRRDGQGHPVHGIPGKLPRVHGISAH